MKTFTNLQRFTFGLLLPIGAALSVSCGDTATTTVNQLNLDRPTDIAFACVGGLRLIPDDRADQTMGLPDDQVVLSAMPTPACDIRSGTHPTGTPVPVPPGQEDLTADGGIPIQPSSWFGFILQSGPGTVALAQFQTKPSTSFSGGDVAVLDADPLTPGKNSISVGEDPIAIATDRSGCKVLTANAGSCDLSVLDVTSAVDFSPSTPIDVRRLDVKNASGEPIRARPAAMVAEPAIDTIGKACPATETGASGLVYIAYPSCHLVAAVDAGNGTVVGGVRYDAAGTPSLLQQTDLDTLTCPDECGGNGTIETGVRPVTIDVEKDPRTAERRMAIGADNSSSITMVELNADTTLPDSLSQVALEDPTGDLGITQLALTPQIGMGGEIHVINDDNAVGGQFQFVYAVATDDTVRVADVLSLGKECDTQVDPRYLRDIRSVATLSCLPVGDAATPPRRAGARSPGIQLPEPAIPLSVDIIRSDAIGGDSRPEEDPTKLIGYFAIVSASNGGVFIVNVDDDDRRDLFSSTRPLLTPMPLIIAHQLRDGISNRGALAEIELNGVTEHLCDATGPDTGGTDTSTTGGPRSVGEPVRNVPVATFSAEKSFELPGFRQLRCDGVDDTRAISELSFAAPEPVRDEVFPDLAALRADETWNLTWEGSLSLDSATTATDGPAVRESEFRVDNTGMHAIDATRPYCNAGVQPFDILQVQGCDPSQGDVQCPLGYRCFVHPNSQVQGIGACMAADEADRLANACEPFLTSIRRYTVGTTESGSLQLLPRRETLRTTPVEGCTSDDQCKTLADYALRNSNSNPPMFDTTAPDTHTWTCNADPNLEPVATGKRCQMRCDATSDCLTGTVCQGGTGDGTKAGFCMEGVVPPQACVNAPQRYALRAGNAFAVVGSRSGFVHATIEDTDGKCIRDPNASPLITGRIPLDPPACDPTADPLSGQLPDGTFEPNPCSFTAETTDVTPRYIPGTCTLDTPASELLPRQAPAIKYRNRGMNLTIVDPTYPGDAECILDRGGMLGNIPHVFPGYALTFRQTAGLSPLAIPVTPALPIKVVRGPTQSIWVIDEGDFLSTSIAQPSTRGKVFRIEPNSLGLINILE